MAYQSLLDRIAKATAAASPAEPAPKPETHRIENPRERDIERNLGSAPKPSGPAPESITHLLTGSPAPTPHPAPSSVTAILQQPKPAPPDHSAGRETAARMIESMQRPIPAKPRFANSQMKTLQGLKRPQR